MLISIEGNIGSGKSTFIQYLKNHFSYYYNKPHNNNVYFLDEPIDTLLQIKDNEGNLLEHFYKNPEKYSYCFQMTTYISRFVKLKKLLTKSKPDDIIIMERSVFADCNVFVRMLHGSGKINDVEYHSYNMLFDSFLDEIPNTLFVYLKTDFNQCHERILSQERPEEEAITLDYLKECEKWHDHWLDNYDYCICVDGNQSVTAHPGYLDILKQMMNYRTNLPKNYDGNDSDNEYYHEANFEKEKWNKRLYETTLENCKKRARTKES